MLRAHTLLTDKLNASHAKAVASSTSSLRSTPQKWVLFILLLPPLGFFLLVVMSSQMQSPLLFESIITEVTDLITNQHTPPPLHPKIFHPAPTPKPPSTPTVTLGAALTECDWPRCQRNCKCVLHLYAYMYTFIWNYQHHHQYHNQTTFCLHWLIDRLLPLPPSLRLTPLERVPAQSQELRLFLFLIITDFWCYAHLPVPGINPPPSVDRLLERMG